MSLDSNVKTSINFSKFHIQQWNQKSDFVDKSAQSHVSWSHNLGTHKHCSLFCPNPCTSLVFGAHTERINLQRDPGLRHDAFQNERQNVDLILQPQTPAPECCPRLFLPNVPPSSTKVPCSHTHHKHIFSGHHLIWRPLGCCTSPAPIVYWILL